jgi:hypothetical protein
VEQGGIQRPEHRGGKPFAGLGKGLGGHLALEIRGPLEVGGKSIEFLLDAATHAGEHEGQQFREGQVATAEEGGGLKPHRVEQIGRVQRLGKGA